MIDNKACHISVIMPAYNVEAYIKDAIESILNQSFQDFEFIIINDGSIDDTENIIRSYTDSRIKLVSNEQNKGLIYSLNLGFSLAMGKYIARMDSDDISRPDRFKKQFDFMESHPDITLLGTAFVFMNTPYEIHHPTEDDRIRIKLLRDTALAHPSVMIRQSDVVKHGLHYNSDYATAEDYQLWTDIAIRGLKIANLSEVLLEYRQHEAQISTSKQAQQEKVTNRIRLEYIHHFFRSFLSEEKLISFSKRFLRLGLIDGLSIAVELSKINEDKRFFDKDQFDLLLKQLMYNCSTKVSFFDFIQALKYISSPSFIATFYNIYRKRKSIS